MSLSVPATPTEAAAAARDGPAAAVPRGRASWSGLLRLSLVTVPVKAYPATATTPEQPCHQLHAGCGHRIRYEKRCPQHGPVDAAAIVRGYPYAPDQYVLIDDDQLEQLRPAQDRALCLERFLDAEQFDPALFSGRSLYLLPDGRAAQPPYAVVTQALHDRRKWGLGWVVLTGHRRLALVRPAGRVLTLHVLHFPAQVRPSNPWEAALGAGPLAAAETDLAAQLIDALAEPVVWSAYRDDRAEQLAALVQAAVQKRPLRPPPAEPAPVLPLRDALQQSLAAARRPQSRAAASPRRGHPRKKAAARRKS
jgi:DNA end-binding protein Ku